MQHTDAPVLRDIVLVGGGHSHIGVLRSFGMRPLPGVRLTLISTELHTPYSGMLPGYVAGHYDFDEIHIDLLRLAGFAKARVYRDEVVGVDRVNQRVLCQSRPPVPYDLLSINIGATPYLAALGGAAQHVTPVKPIRHFNDRWLALISRVTSHSGRTRIAVVGAGAGGIELILAMQWRLHKELISQDRERSDVSLDLLSAAPTILPTHNRRVREHFSRILAERGIRVHLNSPVIDVSQGELVTASQQRIPADEIIWVTRASAAQWLQNTGLALDAEGFIAVNDRLQSTSDPRVFAAGDVASIAGSGLEKAGVFAVRMAKPLTENLRRACTGRSLAAYKPQRSWLALISTGGQHAVASRAGWSLAGNWVWQWKNWIDHRFMRRFSEWSIPAAERRHRAAPASPHLALDTHEAQQATAAAAMRCGGCGAKVSPKVLSAALRDLPIPLRDDVIVGLHDPDDAAVVRVPLGMDVVHSVDFFRSFIDDPYLFGKIAANHALGDLWAMGAQAQSATAVCTLPPGLDSKVQDQLFQLMSGALEVLNEAGCALVGGHTAEGMELALGFAVNGLIAQEAAAVLRKSGIQPTNVLILTKPLGTGALLAAKDRLFAKGRWIDAALSSMALSNRVAAGILRAHGCKACADVTGFGFVGHLREMAVASQMQAHVALDALPLLDGALECVQAGIFSSMAAANLGQARTVRTHDLVARHPRYALVFDPQTAGGLLAAIPADQAQACLAALRSQGYPMAQAVGHCSSAETGLAPIVFQ